MKKTVTLMFCVLVTACATAQSKRIWIDEPSAVFGIPIGAELDIDRISACGGRQANPSKEPVSACVMSGLDEGDLVIAGLPTSVFDGGFLSRSEGVVKSMLLHGKHGDYKDIKTLLIERYGKPTVTDEVMLQNGFGKQFPTENLTWRGKRVTMKLSERSNDPNETTVVFIANDLALKQLIEKRRALSEGASKM